MFELNLSFILSLSCIFQYMIDLASADTFELNLDDQSVNRNLIFYQKHSLDWVKCCIVLSGGLN